MIIVDTDVMVDLLREYPAAVAWFESLGDEEITLPGFVGMELLQGCRDAVQVRRVERLLRGYRVAWPLPDVCDNALVVFARFHLSHNIGIIDALIGQMAVALDTPLQTFNAKHYAVIPGIRLHQPYEKSPRDPAT